MTKKFEEVLRGNTSDILERIEKQPLKGEIVIVIGGMARGENEKEIQPIAEQAGPPFAGPTRYDHAKTKH